MPTTDDTQQEKAARQLVERLRQAGHTAFWAGGCVRDKLLGRPPRDIDIATNAVPDSILEIFPHASAVGKSFGVMIVPCHGFHFETATFRQDHGYQDGRHPTSITFSTPEDDAARRDFTINAMFFDPLTGTIHDFVNGRADLAAFCRGSPAPAARRAFRDHARLRPGSGHGGGHHPPCTLHRPDQHGANPRRIHPHLARGPPTRTGITDARQSRTALRFPARGFRPQAPGTTARISPGRRCSDAYRHDA